MWPFKKKEPSLDCNLAVPYLKKVFEGDNPDAVTLADGVEPYFQPFLDGISIAFLADEGESFSYVQKKHLSETHSESAYLEKSTSNLRSALKANGLQLQEGNGVYYIAAGGDFEASAILLDSFWEGTVKDLIGEEVVAAIPTRDILAFCATSNSHGIETLKGITQKILSEDQRYEITKKLLLRKNRKWGFY